MFKNSQSGFTIIETILFLAISSLMILIAARAISGRTEQVQFTDAIRSTESFFESKVDQVKTGSIARPDVNCRYNGVGYSTNQPSDGSCIFMGYIYRTNELWTSETDPSRSEIDVYQVFGRRTSSAEFQACLDANPNEKIFCSQPVTIPDTPVETFTIPWSIEINGNWSNNVGNSNTMAHLKDPTFSGSVIPVSIEWRQSDLAIRDANAMNNWDIYRISNNNSAVDQEVSSRLCVTNKSTRQAAIWFGHSERQSFVETELDYRWCSI